MSLTLNLKEYTYRQNTAGVSTYINSASNTVNGFSSLTATTTIGKPALGNRPASRSKTMWKLSLPVLAEDDSACGCTGEVIGTCDWLVEVRSDVRVPTSVLADGRLRMKDLIATSEFIASVDSHTQPTA